MGFATAWVAETQHNPFLAASLIAEHSQRMRVGTGIAVSFARSPAVMAQALNQRGEYYKLTLTSPFFTPDAIDFP